MAGEWPSLARPPIIEAILDIQVMPLDRSLLQSLEQLHTALPEYPTKNTRHELAGAIQVSGQGESAVSHQSSIVGFQFTNESSTKVVQARLNGLTLSFLPPYSGYGDLLTEAMRLWRLFCEYASSPQPQRIALRYINRLVLPLPIGDYKEYILTQPEIAPSLPQALDGFSTRLLLPDNKSRGQAIITQITEGVVEPGFLNMIFDIDVFQLIQEPTTFDIWQAVEELRNYKNRIFFGSITPKLQRSYE